MGDMRHVVCAQCAKEGVTTVLDVWSRNAQTDDVYAETLSERGCDKHRVHKTIDTGEPSEVNIEE